MPIFDVEVDTLEKAETVLLHFKQALEVSRRQETEAQEINKSLRRENSEYIRRLHIIDKLAKGIRNIV